MSIEVRKTAATMSVLFCAELHRQEGGEKVQLIDGEAQEKSFENDRMANVTTKTEDQQDNTGYLDELRVEMRQTNPNSHAGRLLTAGTLIKKMQHEVWPAGACARPCCSFPLFGLASKKMVYIRYL